MTDAIGARHRYAVDEANRECVQTGCHAPAEGGVRCAACRAKAAEAARLRRQGMGSPVGAGAGGLHGELAGRDAAAAQALEALGDAASGVAEAVADAVAVGTPRRGPDSRRSRL